jgi:hypothetical protein
VKALLKKLINKLSPLKTYNVSEGIDIYAKGALRNPRAEEAAPSAPPKIEIIKIHPRKIGFNNILDM